MYTQGNREGLLLVTGCTLKETGKDEEEEEEKEKVEITPMLLDEEHYFSFWEEEIGWLSSAEENCTISFLGEKYDGTYQITERAFGFPYLVDRYEMDDIEGSFALRHDTGDLVSVVVNEGIFIEGTEACEASDEEGKAANRERFFEAIAEELGINAEKYSFVSYGDASGEYTKKIHKISSLEYYSLSLDEEGGLVNYERGMSDVKGYDEETAQDIIGQLRACEKEQLEKYFRKKYPDGVESYEPDGVTYVVMTSDLKYGIVYSYKLMVILESGESKAVYEIFMLTYE